MTIGIYTYGTRGDVQPYIALALALLEKGHRVVLAAPTDFKDFVEGFGIPFSPLYGNAEVMMNSPQGQRILKTENSIKLMKYYFKAVNEMKHPLRKSYHERISQVDFIIANSATMPIVSAIAEKQQKKVAYTYFMPPLVPTVEFPVEDLRLLNLGWYNKLTYKIIHSLFWRFIKHDTNEYRMELGLPALKESLLIHVDRQKPLDLYCLSPSLISQPKDWTDNHKITGFLTVPVSHREQHKYEKASEELLTWLSKGDRPVYIGFGSNGIGNQEKFIEILTDLVLGGERILFCTGWSVFRDLPSHKNLFVAKYVNHEAVLPHCKVGVFHGGAGTLAAMLRHNLPVVIVSFYTDQPTWGKLVERLGLGIHIPVKKLTSEKLMAGIRQVQSTEVGRKVTTTGERIRNEKGTEHAVEEIERYFGLSG
ncbi:glycosyltransferase [Puia sp.]|jgi:UDP:flavonoid glycosyltransferase YjiC (YdhE family)|uniref:glycosyltransferase n=1 Tax=Puia sp. TaxID=2045100 RepID=UPI002F3E7232